MPSVEYVEIPQLPGRPHFRCDRQSATISVDACRSMWTAGNAAGSERCTACKGCSIGALHAGQQLANLSPLYGARICARCHRGATRLIEGHLCISCYNRQRELRVGRNAKGVAPIKAAASLARRGLDYVRGTAWARLDLPLAADRIELMVAVLRDSRERVRFALHTPARAGNQMRLF